MQMREGSSFELTGRGYWLEEPDDRWRRTAYRPKGSEKLVGGRYIAGTPCRVWRCPDGKMRAQAVQADA